MRTIPAAILLCLATAPIFAQATTPGAASPEASSPPAATTTAPTDPAMPSPPPTMPATPQTGSTMSNDMSSMPARPGGWTGSDSDWTKHVAACQKRSGYDPATDKYQTSSGQMRTCPR
jgi:hypothetical protein